jgi:hypothetical protein
MVPDPNIMRAVEKLGYRVTVGDVASQAGLDIKLAEQGVLVLASEAGGHLQVAESGEIAYLFPRNFRNVLKDKYRRLQWQERLGKVWKILFYLIRVSFGILLIASIALMVIAITIILVALNSSRNSDDDRQSDSGGGMIFMPHFWFGPDLFWLFSPNYYDDSYREQAASRRSSRGRQADSERQMNFLEAVFSFLFGDGNPNADLEAQRWQTIATAIRNHQGAIAAEQVAPYLDELGSSTSQELEDYILPVLTRFNGRPEVSPVGQIVYHFPELQVTAAQSRPRAVAAYLKESLWRFSRADSGQITLSAGLGVVNIVAALVLGGLLRDQVLVAQLGGLVAFVNVIYPVLLGYGVAFLMVPLIRYFWLKGRNAKVSNRNQVRQERAVLLNQPDATLQQKLTYARQFAAETVVSTENLAYTTETDLTEQELAQSDKIDAEWRRRLGSGS